MTFAACAETEETSCPAADYLAGKTLAREGSAHNRLDADEVWRAKDSPHRVTSRLEVSHGRTLTIERCAVVVMANEASIFVGDGWGATGTGGDLVAQGSAEEPIVFTGQTRSPGSWTGLQLEHTLGHSRLSHVTIEHAGAADGEFAAALWATGGDREVPHELKVDHLTLRSGGANGIVLEREAEFAPDAGELTITGMARFPIVVDQVGVRSVPEGQYTSNGDDRIRVRAYGAVVPAKVGEIRWHKRSIPYFFDLWSYQNYETRLVFEPGVHVFVRGDDFDNVTTIGFHKGGSLVADGGDESGRIVFEGENKAVSASWGGFVFIRDENPPFEHAGPSTMNYVTIKNAGLLAPPPNSAGSCTDLDHWGTVVHLMGDYLTMTYTEVVNAKADSYAVTRDWCGDGSAQFTRRDTGNTFSGPWHCGETNQHPCGGVECDEENACCDHPYSCPGEDE